MLKLKQNAAVYLRNKYKEYLEELESGGRYRSRTSDPLLVREVLSQLS